MMEDVKPRILKTEIGEGMWTWVPYGLSVDVSDFARRLNARFVRLRRGNSVAGAGDTTRRDGAAIPGNGHNKPR